MVQPVELLNTHTTRITFTRSPSGTGRGRQVYDTAFKTRGVSVHTLTGAHGLDRRPAALTAFNPVSPRYMNLMRRSGSRLGLDLNDLRVQRSVKTRRCRKREDELREHAVRVGEKERCPESSLQCHTSFVVYHPGKSVSSPVLCSAITTSSFFP